MKYLSLILSLFFVIPCCAEEAYYFDRYDVLMQVHEDNTITVKETIDAVFTAPRHGIVRDFINEIYVKRLLPDGNGGEVEKFMTYGARIRNVDVSENFETNEESDYYGVRIGRADVLVEGPHRYVITYDYLIGDDRTTIDDIFYFTLYGPAHDTTADTVSFTVRFDKELPVEAMTSLRLFYGTPGDETVRNNGITFFNNKEIHGEVHRLSPNQAVTIYMPLPEGYFVCKKDMLSTAWWIVMGVMLLLLLLLLIRESKQRNNYTKVIECWPPEGMSSADMGYIYDTTVDDCDIISLVPYFAHKGWITIDTTSGHPVLHKRAEIDADAPRYQKELFKGFFSEGDTFDTAAPTKKFGSSWIKVQSGIKSENKGMDNNYSAHILSFFLAGILFLASLFMSDVTENYAIVLFALIEAMGLVYIFLTSLAGWDSTADSKPKRYLLVASWAAVVGLQFYGYTLFKNHEQVYILPDQEIIFTVCYLLFLFASIFAFKLVSMSKNRLKHIGYILGFKEFIETSEKPMLDSLSQEHEQYFFDILPYAIAFGLSEVWEAKFKDMIVKMPDWYVGSNNVNNLVMMTHPRAMYSFAMSKSYYLERQRQAELKAQAASRASSHSSGGFSGGGFGGGGSHSW